MSKLFEALNSAQRSAAPLGALAEAAAPRPGPAYARASIPARLSRVSMEQEMVRLHQHLDALLPDPTRRAIQFMGSCEGEGTSTVTAEFARVSATRFGQRVLLLAGANVAGGRDTTFDIAPIPQENVAAARTTESLGPSEAWERFRTDYDLVLVDSPPATTSTQGLAVCSRVDGVVLVLAAGKTRWPVAMRVKESIERSGGRVLGIVFNRRRYYIPPFVYRQL